MATASAIIIGDEILSGKFPDENGPYLVRRLREIGVDLGRMSIIPDTCEAIADEVRHCSEQFDLVFTTGGVGPTHDDITLESIALAFGEPLELVDELHAILLKRWPEGPPEPAMRMARLPRGAELIWEGNARFPLVRVRNVHIFPGVPYLFQDKFEAVAHRWMGETISTARIHLDKREVVIAEVLDSAQKRWPQVAIGSYPRREDGSWSVIVTLESRDQVGLADAHQFLARSLGTADSS